jgi:hypothetical protein
VSALEWRVTAGGYRAHAVPPLDRPRSRDIREALCGQTVYDNRKPIRAKRCRTCVRLADEKNALDGRLVEVAKQPHGELAAQRGS